MCRTIDRLVMKFRLNLLTTINSTAGVRSVQIHLIYQKEGSLIRRWIQRMVPTGFLIQVCV